MIFLQITAGRGPPECRLAVKHILCMMVVEGCRLVSQNIGGDPESVVIGITDRAYADSWIGTILWICESPIRQHHKRKNWFVGVREVQLPEAGPITIRESDLEWQTMKSSGKGGQHANKNDTAVRLIHIPTGITVVAQDERSQKRNKDIARVRLGDALGRRQDEAVRVLEAENWQQHNEIERGNPTRTFVGPKFEKRSQD